MGALPAIVLTLAATGGGETLLLHFWSDACPPCRQMAPAIDQLIARGHPIQKVHVAQEPGLAARFGVGPVPCFVMVVEGREVDRVVGATTSARLEQMLALAERGRADAKPPIRTVSGQRPGESPLAIPAVRTTTPFSASDPALAVDGVPPDGEQRPPLPARQLTSPDWAGASESSDRLCAALVAATVRLRIKDSSGQSSGSGTIIDARRGEALILTCGHLFRDSQGKGPIEVDLFGPGAAERLPGRLIHYDLQRDLGLVAIATPRPVSVARLAPAGLQIAKGAKVIHVGCNNGDPPTARTGHVTSLNRFLGPPNTQVSGLPVQGRSGGGLFTTDGRLIGVCNAAIPTDNEGLYAALGAIHAGLDELHLAFVYSQPEADAAAGSSPAATLPSMPRRMPPPSDLVRWTEVPHLPPAASDRPPGAGLQGMTPQEAAAWEEIQRQTSEGAEVICIIRRRGDPAGRSDVLVVDRASPAFLQRLADSRLPAGRASDAPDTRLAAGRAANPAYDPGQDWKPRWLRPEYQGE